jgi:acetyl-CoA synthetase
VAGKRIGPAEIENILVGHAAVTEAAAIGIPDEIKGQAVVAFVVLRQEVVPSDSLRGELAGWVAAEMGKPLAPKTIHFVNDIPKTRNAKVMRRVIRSAYLGEPAGDLAALVNPQAVDAIRALRV